MTSVFRRSALLAGAMTLAFATAAAAAPSAAPEAKVEKRVVVLHGEGRHGDDGPGPRAHDPARRAQHLRDMLQLTPAQEPALQAFLAATGPHKMGMAHGGAHGAGAGDAPRTPPTTLERLARHEEMMAGRLEAFRKHAAAVRAFYAQLTPSQKKAFDAMPMMHGGMRHGPMFMHGAGPGERRVKIIRGAAGPDGKMAWRTMEGDDIEVLVGELGDLGIDLPPPPPAPPAPPAPPPPPPPPPVR